MAVAPSRLNLDVHVPSSFGGRPTGGPGKLGVFATFETNANVERPAEVKVQLPEGMRVTSVLPGETPFRQNGRELSWTAVPMNGIQFHAEVADGAPGFSTAGGKVRITDAVTPQLVSIGGDTAAGRQLPKTSTEVLLPRGWEQTGGTQAERGPELLQWDHTDRSSTSFSTPGDLTVEAAYTGGFKGQTTTGAAHVVKAGLTNAAEFAGRIVTLPVTLPFMYMLARAEQGK